MKNYARIFVAILAIFLECPRPVFALDQSKMLNLRVGDRRYTGRVLSHDDQSCWFLGRDGRLQQIAADKVTAFAEMSDRFHAHSHVEMKNQLQAEFGMDFEVRTTHHFVVAARRKLAESYASLFERIYRETVRAFRVRGLDIAEPEFPLVAIVFPDREAFVKYCKSEKASVPSEIVGFYLPLSNRVAMFEHGDGSEVDATVIHEATHQVAFNTGVHSRLAEQPRWVVEGLAMVFEADGIRIREGTISSADRINRERYLWFREYANSRRTHRSLADFIRDDKSFDKSLLDAYSEAWALTFFLLETRPTKYSEYVKILARRELLATYLPQARLKDFTQVFGEDLDELEVTYLRFIKRIAER